MTLNLRERAFRAWYWYVSKVDKKAEVLFMNYGFSEVNHHTPLNGFNHDDRYSCQLYHHLAIEIELKDKDIVEVGSGRGGGLSYITSKFAPAKAIGIDMNPLAVDFCNKHYKHPELSFLQGDAQKLSLESNSCDVVINVESSHRYPNMEAFLGEVHRILRPNGHFLFTDFRLDTDYENLRNLLKNSGLKIIKERNINKEVVNALNLDDGRRRGLVHKLTPRILHKVALNFAGAIGSETYNRFDTGKYVYFSYVLSKA